MNCLNCNKDINPKKSELKRGNGKFCSISCSVQYQHRTKLKPKSNVICSYCKKPFYKSPSRMKRSKSGLFFCCREHKNIAQRINGIKEIHPSHFNNGSSVYRDIAFREYPHKCNRCDYDENTLALIVHHKDRDRSNNSLSNLEIICANCHLIEHLST